MATPDAALTSVSVNEDYSFNDRSKVMSNSQNMMGVDPRLDARSIRKPDYFVYVFSVVDPRPDGYHLFRDCSPLIHKLKIAELKKGERYTLVTKIPQPLSQRWLDPASNQWRVDEHKAEQVAQDVVFPGGNLTEGNNFADLGVFWSRNETPTDEEVMKAVQRKEAFYRKRLDQCRALEASDPKSLYAFLTPTDHVAADYFGEEFTWHKVSKKAESCPNCGEPIKAGVAFHPCGALGGVLCVIDWKRAVEAGVKKLEDVPESKRWDSKSSRKGGA